MNFRRALAASAASLLMIALASGPALADDDDDDDDDDDRKTSAVAPILLSDTKIAWVSGSTGWINLSWTAQADLENVKVTLSSKSKGFSVDYPENHDGFSSLMVDEDLSTHEIDFTAVQISTDGKDNGTKWADVLVEWEHDGRQHRANVAQLKFSNKKYKGDDFAILTETVTASTKPADSAYNWIELGYLGLSPMNSALEMTVKSGLPVYHPQGSFTSLHHDEMLHGGESDVSRVWFDPELIESGIYPLVIEISYRDYTGRPSWSATR